MESKTEASISINFREGDINITGSEAFVEKNMNRIFEFVERYGDLLFENKQQNIDENSKKKESTTDIRECADKKSEIQVDKYVEGGVYHLDTEDNTISILKDVPGLNKSEKMKNIALIVLYIRKEKIHGKEIIPICEKHGCYDASNFSSVFKKEKTNMIRKGSGQNWTIELTHLGEKVAVELLEGMLNDGK